MTPLEHAVLVLLQGYKKANPDSNINEFLHVKYVPAVVEGLEAEAAADLLDDFHRLVLIIRENWPEYVEEQAVVEALVVRFAPNWIRRYKNSDAMFTAHEAKLYTRYLMEIIDSNNYDDLESDESRLQQTALILHYLGAVFDSAYDVPPIEHRPFLSEEEREELNSELSRLSTDSERRPSDHVRGNEYDLPF